MNDRYPEEQLDEDEDNGTMPANVAVLAEAVVGRRIVSVEQGATIPDGLAKWRWRDNDEGVTLLTLDDGCRVYLCDTDDCCAYTELEGVIKHLDQIDHVITGVGTTGGFTKWHIYADMGDVLELSVGWSAGNPFYYGYGFDIYVRDAS